MEPRIQGMQKLQDEWQLMSRYIDRVTAEREG